ncbi:MAG: hypothetical protein D6755_01645 [Anaerolineae bacterium]|nr:MAG: hypothetical protein D6755_01645 [Anaerolineae bacterium]
MQEVQNVSNDILPIWERWKQTLRQWGGTQAAITVLEAFGPLTIVAAQFLYLGEPLFASRHRHWQSLAHLLEDSEQQRAFIRFLQENEA